jgi:hypothetical protein
MGGDPNPSSSAGGGSGVTINNNIDGYMLRASGVSNTITGLSAFTYDGSSAFTMGADLQISGTNNNLLVQGSDAAGNLNVLYRIEVSGGLFKAVPV